MKRFKSKGVKKFTLVKTIILVLIVYYSFSISLKYLFSEKIKKKVSSEVLVSYLITNSTNNMVNSDTYLFKDVASKTLLDLSLNNLVLDTVYLNDSYEKNSVVTQYFEDPNNYEVNNPIIYIYNTHQLEEYSNSNVAVYDASPNVLMASYILKEKLNELDIATIVEQTNINQILTTNNWKYSYSYKASRMLVSDAIINNNSLKYFIDLHRDSMPKDKTTLKVNDKNYAKVLFVVGTEHDNYQANLNIANNLSNIINSKVSGLSKGVLKKGGEGNNGIYNQDLSENSLLIEIGGYENTIDEVTNTIDIIADSLYELIRGKI